MDATTKHRPSGDEHLVDAILKALDGLRYGAVEITVHDSRIVQIERKEKLRFDAVGANPRV